MFNTLYNIAGGIALTIGALGASDDFDGAELVQNAFFGPEDESVILDEQEMATEEVLVANDLDEWDEIAAKVMSMTIADNDELTEGEKLEIAVLKEEFPSDVSDNLEDVEQIEEISQLEGLSENDFYSMLERQYNDAMSALEQNETVADNDKLVIEAGTESDPFENLLFPEETKEVTYVDSDEMPTNIKLQPEDDLNAEKALEKAVSNSAVKEQPWDLSNDGVLPDIPEEDMNIMTNQTTDSDQPVKTELPEIENVNAQEIPVIESDFFDVPEVDAPEIEEINMPVFVDSENADVEEIESEEVETENADVEETEAEEVETENADVEEIEAEEVETENADVEEIEAEEVETENADVEETEAEEVETENADVEKTEAEEVEDDALIVEPLEDDAFEAEQNDDALLIPSLEIPPTVLSEEQRAKISEEVDALVDQSDNFDSWIPRQIPVSGSVDDAQPQTKPEDDFIQDFSRKHVKESILENNGIELND